jgi:hypothetical protein
MITRIFFFHEMLAKNKGPFLDQVYEIQLRFWLRYSESMCQEF